MGHVHPPMERQSGGEGYNLPNKPNIMYIKHITPIPLFSGAKRNLA